MENSQLEILISPLSFVLAVRVLTKSGFRGRHYIFFLQTPVHSRDHLYTKHIQRDLIMPFKQPIFWSMAVPDITMILTIMNKYCYKRDKQIILNLVFLLQKILKIDQK